MRWRIDNIVVFSLIVVLSLHLKTCSKSTASVPGLLTLFLIYTFTAFSDKVLKLLKLLCCD